MFKLFSKPKLPPVTSFNSLGVDIHAHWLPGIDDGAPDLATSLALLRRMEAMGFHTLYATPHVMADLYPNTPEIINAKLAEVRKAAAKEGIRLNLFAAAEYLMDEAFGDKIKSGNLLTLPGKRVLVEMSFISPPPNLDLYIFQLQTKGYKVVLAHPERYLFYRDDFSKYESFKSRGCELQVNLLSMAGYYGKPTQDNALQLLKRGWIDYAGTDMHHERHANNLAALLEDPTLNKLLATHIGSLGNEKLLA